MIAGNDWGRQLGTITGDDKERKFGKMIGDDDGGVDVNNRGRK